VKKALRIAVFSLVIIFILTFFFNTILGISKNMFDIKMLKILVIEKMHFGGIAINNTSHPVMIVSDNFIQPLYPHTNSRKSGIFDTDDIILKTPFIFEGQKYHRGIIKFCDLATVKIYEKEGLTIVKPSLSYFLCNKFENTSGVFLLPERTLQTN